jgi:hypothetical protein
MDFISVSDDEMEGDSEINNEIIGNIGTNNNVLLKKNTIFNNNNNNSSSRCSLEEECEF